MDFFRRILSVCVLLSKLPVNINALKNSFKQKELLLGNGEMHLKLSLT